MEQEDVLRDLVTIISFLLKYLGGPERELLRPDPTRAENHDDDLFQFDRFRIFVWEGIKKKLRPITSVAVLRRLG